MDLNAGTVEIRGTAVRVKGQELWIKSKPKSGAEYRKIMPLFWAVGMLRDPSKFPSFEHWRCQGKRFGSEPATEAANYVKTDL